ncbi:Pfs, NACHT and Ankyrin domain protein, partial [Talaromyces stipitatus ATCC 10500]
METPPSRYEFQIGWICALPIEAAAAIQMLDENFGILQEQERTDSNTYTLGRIGRHYVVIACLPDGQYGTTSATTVANNMMRTFRDSLRIGLMVGIGGGAPSVEHDIRLGDIVVSRPEGSYGGVIQHDMRKIGRDGKTQLVGSLNSPPKSLLNALAQMRAAELYDDPQYPVYLQEAIGKNKRTRNTFSRPDVDTDRLFKIEYEHPENEASCDQCLVKWEEDRITREDGNPQTHYGTIASGNTLIKDGKTREAIRKDTGALCFEMEAAGLMADFPCLVVRGICDYADSHKNKQWQGYAALAAAAFTKELLGYVPKGVSQESLVADMCPLLKDIKEDQRKAFDQRESHHREKMERVLTEDQRRCHQAFKTSTYEKFKNINPNRVEGTCEWVLNSPEYLRWWNATSNNLLWISADPGCGKSVLAKSLIDSVFGASDPTVSIVYFFFKDNDEQNNLATALCAVLHQLFSWQPQLLRHALPFWERNKEKIQYEVDDMWRIFMAATSDRIFKNTVCVFDALDECHDVDQKQLIERLREFHDRHQASQGNWLKFLVTSRPYDDIQDCFRPVTEFFPQVHLRGEEENDQIHEEINLVVKVKVTELGKDLGLRADTQQRLIKELREMKHRTYLWLYLAIDDIKRTLKNSLRPDNETIPSLPKDVPEAYERILNRAPSDQKATVEIILRIIVGARRPLSVQEMAMALGVATSPDAETAAEAGLNPSALDKKIRQLCGLFVFIKESRIYLIHQTAREFLISRHDRSANMHWHLEQRKTEIQMTEICLKYLLLNDLVSNVEESIRSLLDYSAENWADHFRDVVCPDDEIVNRAWKLYDVRTERFRLWFPKFWTTAMPYHPQPQMEALHLAAFNGHQGILCRIDVNKTGAIDQVDGSRTTALQWACEQGRLEIVQLLLEKGADVNAKGGGYGNALQAAAERGHLKIVQLLLEKGADVNAQGGGYGNALQDAAEGGHLDIVQLLLEKGADINAQGGYYGNALQAAAEGGHLEIVQLLLQKGADVNAQGGRYGNALQAAANGGHLEIVQLLLEKGADVNAQGGRYGNALQAATNGGHLETVQLLLEKGVDVNAQGGYYGNALQAAAEGGHFEIVQLLLQKGADVNAQGGEYGNVLQAAANGRRLEIVQLLLEKGADVNAQGGYYGNALQAATNGGHLNIVQLLLEKGADVNAQGGEYGNALQAAANGGRLETVQLLLQKGADINAQGGEYGNALQAATNGGHLEIVQLLLEKGADVNAQGGRYGNALQAATNGGHLEIVQLLLEKGADINAQGGYYGNALQAAAEGGHLEIVQLLLEKGADVNAQGGYYGNALQAATNGGHLEIVQLLLENGADVNAQGGRYGNALQAATNGGHLEIVQLLLEKGADVNAQGGRYGNALQAATNGGHLDTVQLLLEKGAYINAQGGIYGNALQAATNGGHLDIVQLLLQKEADVNAQGGFYGNALQAATNGGRLEIVQLLLQKGADVNAQGGYYGNALWAATNGGRFGIARLLLEKGADVNAQGGYYGNALQAATKGGNLKTVQLLLQKGANVNAQGGFYGNVLQAATNGGRLETVQLLLQKGADVNAQGGYYGNALQAATNGGHLNIVQLLLEKGADVNAQGGYYGNALQAATNGGHLNIVQLLLEKGADVNAQGGFYGNALHAAAE